MLEDKSNQHAQVVDKYIDPAANVYMTTRDYVVRPSASGATGPITIYLPPVTEAKGRSYSIYVIDADATNTVTVADLDDSEGWVADIPYNEGGQGLIAYSDGRHWSFTPIGVAAYAFSSARIDATTVIRTQTCSLTITAAASANMIETVRFTALANVRTGTWINAVCAVVNFSTSGYATGCAGVVCAELDMPNSTIPGGAGTYWVYEAELNCPASFAGGVPIGIFGINVWGSGAAQFDTYGYLFDITGVTKASGKFFQDNTAAAASQALRCRINGTAYYVMLTSTGA